MFSPDIPSHFLTPDYHPSGGTASPRVVVP